MLSSTVSLQGKMSKIRFQLSLCSMQTVSADHNFRSKIDDTSLSLWFNVRGVVVIHRSFVFRILMSGPHYESDK